MIIRSATCLLRCWGEEQQRGGCSKMATPGCTSAVLPPHLERAVEALLRGLHKKRICDVGLDVAPPDQLAQQVVDVGVHLLVLQLACA